MSLEAIEPACCADTVGPSLEVSPFYFIFLLKGILCFMKIICDINCPLRYNELHIKVIFMK